MVPDAIVGDSPVPAVCNAIVTTDITDLWNDSDGLAYRYLITCVKRPATLVIPLVYTDIILMGVDKK